MAINAGSLLDINTKIERIFKNPNINFFIIMNLILIITCYTLLNNNTQSSIRYILSKPLIIISTICVIILIGYFNLNIAILCIVLLFIMLFTTSNMDTTSLITNLNIKKLSNVTENFDNMKDDGNDDGNDDDNDDGNDDDNDYSNKQTKYKNIEQIKSEIAKSQDEHRTKYKADNVSNIEKKVSNFANMFTKNINSLKETTANQLKTGLLENKHKLLEKIENENKIHKNTSENTSKHTSSNIKSKNLNKSNKSNKSKTNEKFQSIELRKFNPTSEDDTNLLITKEILQDMINRITYNYESTTYLKKYLKHRLEEIIDTNNLLKDDDE